MALSIALATATDAGVIAALRRATADDLTSKHGRGHWSARVTEKGVTRVVMTSQVLVARDGGAVVGTVRLESRKPWAIDTAYFAPVALPLYLHDLAVDPRAQRGGIGRRLVDEATKLARAWPAGAIRLDAYDHAAGAGPFYAKCGFREVGRVTYRRTPLVYYELLL
jgi:GNAT superfamily N-acetyltransferase